MDGASSDQIKQSHRWHAVECNNLAWDMIEKGNVGPEERDNLLNAAHAARFHWLVVGNAENDAAADHLLAIAHALVGSSQLASEAACRALAIAKRGGLSPWADALTHAVVAYTGHCIGDTQTSASHLQTAITRARAFEDERDRKHFFALLNKLPGWSPPTE